MIATILKIRLYGDPCLRKKSAPVKDVGPAERVLIEALLSTMYEHKGVGLAAPQVGINQQIFVADVGEGPRPLIVINPHIVKNGKLAVFEEGCLSIPGITVKVRRPEKIKVKFINEHNEPMECEFEGLLARVVQHEADHLKGRLITDYAGLRAKLLLKGKLKDIQSNAKQT